MQFVRLRTGHRKTAASPWLFSVLGLVGCGGSGSDQVILPDSQDPDAVDVLEPATARWEQVENFEADLVAPRHPSDGQGTARLILAEGEAAQVQAGTRKSWEVEYTAGPDGLAVDAILWFMPEPFWGWTNPQNHDPSRLGYVSVSTAAQGVALDTQPDGRPQGAAWFRVRIGGRGLNEGETIRLRYGEGEGGAQADTYAERDARLWLAVDGDGDGVRVELPSSPTIEVLPGPARRIKLTSDSTAKPGEKVKLRVAVLDAVGNAVSKVKGSITWGGLPADWELPKASQLAGDAGGFLLQHFTAKSGGLFRATARLTLDDGQSFDATANPLIVHERSTPLYWGDFHGHSNLSDGTGVPEDYFRYARDFAGLDVVALTDHDHFGVRFLDQHAELWEGIREQTAAFHDPPNFVTLLGYEWTSWIHGHRHVLYFSDEGRIYSSITDGIETPRELWDALKGQDAITLTHHSAGSPIPTNWSFAPDPVLEPLAEVMSVHGSSEAADSPARLRGAIPGNFVRDALERGYQLGFIGSGDSHDGHPGLPHLDPTYGYRPARPDATPGSPMATERMGNGGLAGIRAKARTRASILEALRARRVYATSGPRIVLRFDIDGRRGGERVARGTLAPNPLLRLDVFGCAPLERIDVIRSGGRVDRTPMMGELDAHLEFPLSDIASLDYVYVRVLQMDGGLAWSSPIFFE
ncbi:MAG: hypothetical protein ACI841_004941 [Planctomycetota bacterium]|jgi:hypothetical protein